MAGVLVVPEQSVKVNACGHLIEISPQGSASVSSLLWELVGKLKVCNPASLQLADLAGQPIKTDEELNTALREGRQPLQAKLTVAALHEIEQKKKEARIKEQDMVGLQWQIVIEQVASFQYDLTSVAGQLQSMKDECSSMVHQFENQEELRRQQIFAAIKDEKADREAFQRELLAKMDEVTQTVMSERSAREVADYQLGKQIEDAFGELNIERNGRAKDQAEFSRLLAALRHDVEAETQNHAHGMNRNLETLKRLEQSDKDHTVEEQHSRQKIVALEADVDKLRVALASLDSNVNKQLSDTSKHLQKHGEEVSRVIRERSLNGVTDINRVSKEHDTSWQSLENQVHRIREELTKGQLDLAERNRMLELRCCTLEKDHADHKAIQSSSEYGLLDKMHTTVSAVDSLAVDRQAAEVVLRTTTQRLDDLVRRMGSAELQLDSKVHEEHFKTQVENVVSVVQKLDMRLAQLDKEVALRLSQEAAHRDGLRTQLHGSIKTCLDKITVNDGGEMKSIGSLKTDIARPVSTSQTSVRGLNGQGSSAARPLSPMPQAANSVDTVHSRQVASIAWGGGNASPTHTLSSQSLLNVGSTQLLPNGHL